MRVSRVGLVLAIFLAAGCSSVVSPAPSLVAVTPSCEAPPAISLSTGSPIPIVLACDKAVAEAFASLPASSGGRSGGDVAGIYFGYGRYCPPGNRCGPFAGRGDLGYVVFTFRDGSMVVVNVTADQNGVVTIATDAPGASGPTP